MLFVKYSDGNSAMQKTDADSADAFKGCISRKTMALRIYSGQPLPWPDAKKTGQVLPCPVKSFLAPESGP